MVPTFYMLESVIKTLSWYRFYVTLLNKDYNKPLWESKFNQPERYGKAP